jgi:glycosyltransferase involved in cell wall biosynthesis
MKVLISAYSCEPNKGSEPGVGWNWVEQMGRTHEVWVVTRANNRQPIETCLKERPMVSVHWVYFDLPRWARFWKRGNRGTHVYYCLWQIGIYQLARRLHGEVHFDLIHHVTFANYWLPVFISFLPAPFVWGPVGGGESSPSSFFRTIKLRARIFEYARNLARILAATNPFVRCTARSAHIAFASTGETAMKLRSLGAGQVLVMSQAALPADDITRLSMLPPSHSQSFRILSIGTLTHVKAFHLSMMAFSQFHQVFPESEYWLIGNGPERRRLEQMGHELGISDSIRFLGALPRYQTFSQLGQCHVLIHPSLHDSGGWVCLEAMAAGRPVICLDLGGPALLVTSEAGIKIPATTPEQAVEDMANALLHLANNQELHSKMGMAARRLIDHASWNEKAKLMNEAYKYVSSEHSGRSIALNYKK